MNFTQIRRHPPQIYSKKDKASLFSSWPCGEEGDLFGCEYAKLSENAYALTLRPNTTTLDRARIPTTAQGNTSPVSGELAPLLF